jgi:hypothetical protein
MPGLVTTAEANCQRFLPVAHAAQQTGQVFDPVADHVDDLAHALHAAVAGQRLTHFQPRLILDWRMLRSPPGP